MAEWWELQDRLEAEGWKIDGFVLRWPDGTCSPLGNIGTPEVIVRHVWEFVQGMKKQCPNLNLGKQGRMR